MTIESISGEQISFEMTEYTPGKIYDSSKQFTIPMRKSVSFCILPFLS